MERDSLFPKQPSDEQPPSQSFPGHRTSTLLLSGCCNVKTDDGEPSARLP